MKNKKLLDLNKLSSSEILMVRCLQNGQVPFLFIDGVGYGLNELEIIELK